MIGAKHMDPVVGVDIHIILIPTPGGPVPTPLPHPFVGMVFDPMDLAPVVGATVIVNGMPVGIAGTGAINKPPGHIPMGGPFQKPPANEGEIFMGSSTVLADGEPFSYTGLPVLTCSDIGVPPPPRAKKKGGTNSLTMPTSVVLSIPMGMPVIVNGPPTISLMGMVMKLGMKALGKGFKKLRKLQKSSKKMKALSDKVHKAASKAMKKMGVPPNVQKKVHKAICTVTGHPVDVATGKVFTDSIDFELPGPVPLKWERTWDTTSVYQGPLGNGWHHQYDLALLEDREENVVALRLSDGRSIAFPTLEKGDFFFNRAEKLTIFKKDEGYVIRDANQLYYRFQQGWFGEDPWPLASVSNASGKSIQFSYDDRGFLKEIRDSAGRLLSVDTDAQGRILAIHAPHPDEPGKAFPIIRYEYDREGNMTRAIDPLDQTFQYFYEDGLLVKETNRNGLSFYFQYDNYTHSAKCTRTWGDGGIYDHKLEYREGVTVVENSLGYKKTYYHKNGLVYREVDPLGHEKGFQFNEFNELEAENDELGQHTEYQFDDKGNKVSTIYPDGSQLKLQYNDRDLLTAAVDQVGGTWSWSYDENDRVTNRVDCLGRMTMYRYNDAGQLITIIDPAGGQTLLGYDPAENIEQVTTPDNASSRWEYDRIGRTVRTIDPKGNIQERHFDLKSQVYSVLEPDGNRRFLQYDGEGNVTYVKDHHQEVKFEYQGMGRLKAREENKTRVEFRYDLEENLTAIFNEHGSVYRFDLDARGEVEAESGFDGVKRYYQRDAAGRVKLVMRASGIETRYDYDPLDRVVGVRHSNGERESYSYRPDGELTEARNDAGLVQMERDLLGRVIREVQNGVVITSSYDQLGMRIRLESSLGADMDIIRNGMGDVLSLSARTKDANWGAQFQRDVFGLEISRLLPGGVKGSWERDRLGRPLKHQITGGGGRLERSREYKWDVNDRLKKFIDFGKEETRFEHDAVGNLASATYANGEADLRLPDAVGNLFRKSDRSDRKYGPAGQLLEAEGTKYEYDAEGNLVKKTSPDGQCWLYDWNAAGMLSRVVRPDLNSVIFTYDPLGRRLSKSYLGKTTRWVWDGNMPLHEWTEDEEDDWGEAFISITEKGIETEEGDEIQITENSLFSEPKAVPKHVPSVPLDTYDLITWYFEPESFSPIAKIVAGKRYSIQTDHLGTPVSMHDESGLKVWSANISAYGDLRDLEGDRQACPFRWPGQYEDVETGLYYNRFRYYDWQLGGYLSPDPIGLMSELNFYQYVLDICSGVDPFGLAKFTPKTKGGILAENSEFFGENTCEKCLTPVVPAQKSERGVSPPSNEAQIDHIKPESKGGPPSEKNGQVLCRKCNREKSNKNSRNYKKRNRKGCGK